MLTTYRIIVLRKLREFVNMDNSTMSEKNNQKQNENSLRDIDIVKIKKEPKRNYGAKKYNKCK